MSSDSTMQNVLSRIQKLEMENVQTTKEVQEKKLEAAELSRDIEEIGTKNEALEAENVQLQKELETLTYQGRQKELQKGVWEALLTEKKAILTAAEKLLKERKDELWRRRVRFCDEMNKIESSHMDGKSQTGAE